MESSYLKSLITIVNLFFCLLSVIVVNAQTDDYEGFRNTILTRIDSTLDIAKYDEVFIVHFNFCSSTRYCGKNLIQYINTSKSKNILIIADDIKNEYLKGIKEDLPITLFSLEVIKMQKYGIFSVYNMQISKERKIKKLQ